MRSQGEKYAHNFLAPPAKIGGAGGWLKGQWKHSQKKAAGRQWRTASAGSYSDHARAPPPKGARKPEGRRPAKPREKRAAIAGPRRGGDPAQESGERAQANEPQNETREREAKKSKGGEAGRSLNPCPFVERSATPGGCRAEAFESAARGKSRTRSGG